jgi:predicted nucleotidyltransferase component of viral defense system
MAEKLANLGASVRAKLLNQARASGQPFDLILVRFALERLLYRLSVSGHAERFVLKGAMLLTTWFDDPARPTRDLDLLGFGDPDPDAMQATFREILSIDVDDGILFNPDTLRVDRIREALDYGGVRLRAVADVGGARVPVAIDVGFGDALEPGTELLEYPTLLDQPAPKLRAYARETVIAEKFQAMVALGRANSRMKDFYDIWLLATTFAFEDDRLVRAIKATFDRRETAIPAQLPDALTRDFGEDPAKIQQWEAFKRDLGADPGSLINVCATLASFLGPQAEAARVL